MSSSNSTYHKALSYFYTAANKAVPEKLKSDPVKKVEKKEEKQKKRQERKEKDKAAREEMKRNPRPMPTMPFGNHGGMSGGRL